MSKELWLRADMDTTTVQMALISVVDGKVLVDGPTLAAMAEHRKAAPADEDEPAWMITYPVMVELLEMHGFRQWEVRG